MDMNPRESIGLGRLAVACALAVIVAGAVIAHGQTVISQPIAAELANASSKNDLGSTTIDAIPKSESHNHIIHRFDFTEPDNLYPEPKHWIRFPDPSLPMYPYR